MSKLEDFLTQAPVYVLGDGHVLKCRTFVIFVWNKCSCGWRTKLLSPFSSEATIRGELKKTGQHMKDVRLGVG